MFLRRKGGFVVAMRWGEETWNSWNVVFMRRIYAFFAFFCQGGEGENRHKWTAVPFWYKSLRLAWVEQRHSAVVLSFESLHISVLLARESKKRHVVLHAAF
jgi:hypothetical protein